MTDAIRFSDVSVRYERRDVVGPVSFSVPAGSVYGLLGRNGAGKTSLVRALTGQIRPWRGSIVVAGGNAWHDRASVMRRVGVVPEEPDVPPAMTPLETIDFFDRIHPNYDASSARERMRRFSVPMTLRFGQLSKGQKKQVTLALALAAAPEILILDDPTLGLDVVARKELFEELIGELADRGVTMFVTTHDLAGIESIADHVGILNDGKLVLDEEIETLKQRFRRIRFSNAGPGDEISKLAILRSTTMGNAVEAIVSGYDDARVEDFRRARPDSHVEVVPMSLEDIFLAIDEHDEGTNE